MSLGTYADLLRALGQNESGNNYSFVTLSGGGGGDTFHLFEGSNADLVLDFSYWEGDRVDVSGSYWVSQTDQGVAIDVPDGRMILQGMQLSSLPDGWIF